MTADLPWDEFLAGQRWFADKGRDVVVTDVRRLADLPADDQADGQAGDQAGDQTGDGPSVTVELVTVTDRASGATTAYQVPTASYHAPQSRIEHALIGVWSDDSGEHYSYDALHDRDAMDRYLRAFAGATDAVPPLEFHSLPGHDLDLGTHSTLLSAEQSNSSVAFGDDSLMKVFRKLTPGVNPDIEVHRALTEVGNRNIASLYGWLEVATGDQPLHLAMLQEFLRTASDGFDLALASVRNLYAEADLHADEVGGDFDGESHRLGSAVAEVHQVLREHFPVAVLDPGELAASMTRRLDTAYAEVGALEPYVGPLRRLFASLPSTDLPTQRVHGDLHLGQTLRTSLGWKLVDFEGEPAKPLAERTLPDSPWRDVAGMLRSFDYAARTAELDFDVSLAEERQLSYRGDEWVARNRQAFLDGYADASGAIDDVAERLIRAYEADKAVYEVLYEARNRPHWVQIPLGALARLTGVSR